MELIFKVRKIEDGITMKSLANFTTSFPLHFSLNIETIFNLSRIIFTILTLHPILLHKNLQNQMKMIISLKKKTNRKRWQRE